MSRTTGSKFDPLRLQPHDSNPLSLPVNVTPGMLAFPQSTLQKVSEETLKEAKRLKLDPHDPIDAICLKVELGEMGVVQASDRLEETFRAQDLLYEMVIHCRQLGFDPSNRDNTLGNALEVKDLISDIAFMGWSWKEVAQATCCEIEPGNKTVEKANRGLCSAGALAPANLPKLIHLGVRVDNPWVTVTW